MLQYSNTKKISIDATQPNRNLIDTSNKYTKQYNRKFDSNRYCNLNRWCWRRSGEKRKLCLNCGDLRIKEEVFMQPKMSAQWSEDFSIGVVELMVTGSCKV